MTKNPNASRNSNYDARTFTLQANVPLPLPPARDYVIIEASLSREAVYLTVSDSNGDPAQWPVGVKVSLATRMPARLLSTVTQSVTVLMVEGDVSVDDNRAVPMPINGAPNTVSSGVIVAGGNLVIVPAVTNVRGLIVYGVRFIQTLEAINSDITSSLGMLAGNSTYGASSYGNNGVGPVNVPVGYQRNVMQIMPPGDALIITTVIGGTARCGYSVIYKVL